VSLHSIVSDGLAGRLHRRDAADATAVARPVTSQLAVLLSGTSMRFLETGLALAALGVALLIGLGR
jgi:hypothetical protein